MLASCTATRGTYSHLISQMTLTLTQGKNRFVLPLKLSIVCDKKKSVYTFSPSKKKLYLISEK